MSLDVLGFVFKVVWALALVGLLLFGMTYVARALQRGRLVVGASRRLITPIESMMLAQNVAVHVVKVAEKYYLLGGGSGGVELIAELPPEHIAAYIEAQRATLADQRQVLMRPFLRWKKP